MDSFPTCPTNTLSSSVTSTPHVVKLTIASPLHVTEDLIVEMILQMENVLNLSNTNQALFESLLSHFNELSGEKPPTLQHLIEVPI